MDAYTKQDNIEVYHGDCRDVLSELYVEATACVTDPPYGLAFMGRSWDDFKPREYQGWCMEWGEIVMDVLVPGAPVLAFSGTRTAHRLTCGLEDAGLTIRDRLAWMYGSGFPKSHDVSKAIDDAKDAEREVVGEKEVSRDLSRNGKKGDMAISREPVEATTVDVTAPATDEAEKFDGYGTALSPSHEPITLAMKPKDGTYAENALRHGVAGLNIDAARIEAHDEPDACDAPGWDSINKAKAEHGYRPDDYEQGGHHYEPHQQGRWPANVVLDEGAAGLLDEQSGTLESGYMKPTKVKNSGRNAYGDDAPDGYVTSETYGDSGGASRFFYTAKASKSDRNAGLPAGEENDHPTVKPTDLIGWLLRLVEMPERNLILDPFAGSGTTAYVCQQMGLPCIAIEQDEENCELIAKRLSEPSLFSK